MHASLKLFTLLSAAATAFAAPVDVPTSFKLVANVISFDLTPSIQGYELSVNSSTGYAYLTEPGTGATFTQTSTGIDTDVTGQTTHMLITPGGTATVPSDNEVVFTSGEGTTGVDIEGGLLAYQNGGFTACPAGFLVQGNNNVLINYRKAGQRFFYGCANITLVAQ